MKTFNPTMIAGLIGVLYFVLLTLFFSIQDMELAAEIAFGIVTIVGLIAVWDNFRDRNNSTWATWTGLVGGLLIAVPGICLLLGNLVLLAVNGNPSTMVNTLLSVAAIGALFLLPIGIIMCLIAGFSRFYTARKV
ncbi:hypothetical protein N24_0312 [Corynebacterium suranareeae]|uniref:Uncharacterized protein n=1 Tax=Corynebacterium suranareeae TaxID=2506452 RepID=A0A160PMP8_9CORY|nr:hypothetical protein [Corynebacterium suranareeae]BAU94574.1 hypothetical protein N24_0312 [Corynebacterium suranareeae]